MNIENQDSNFSSMLSGCMTLSKLFTPCVQCPCKICHLQNEENDTYLEDQEVHRVRGLGTKAGASGQSLDCLSCRQPVSFSLPVQ